MTQQLAKIEELKNKLVLLGYDKHQINQIIRDAVEEEDISQLSETQQDLLVETLQEYFDFALKCHKKNLTEI